MAQSLYRKWRPQTFGELKGQDAIRDTLVYALAHDQLSHAYLFCGPRGTGKTTTARLIAKFINCDRESGDRPCNICQTCVSIGDGRNLDILELDAASNRGIDEIRQLREAVRYAPTQAKHKVYIVDEVHMLTREAFNALLKTLEEPPGRVVFILATTEAHKVPATISSRCQRYDFRSADVTALAEHLLVVAKAEAMALTPDAARFIARLGDGSYRDALSALEQVRAADKAEYTLKVVENLFGYVPRDEVQACLAAILAGEAAAAHGRLDTILSRGGDLRAISDQLARLSQECLEGVILADYASLGSELENACRRIGVAGLVNWIEWLLEAIHQGKLSPIPRLPLDLAIAKLAAKSPPPAVAPVAESSLPPTEVTIISGPAKSERPANAEDQAVSIPVVAELPKTIDDAEWRQVMVAIRLETPSLFTSLAHARITGVDGDTVNIAVPYKMHAEKINQHKHRASLETLIGQVMRTPLKVNAYVADNLPLDDDEVVNIAEVFELEES